MVDGRTADAELDSFRIEMPASVEQRVRKKQHRDHRAFLKGPVPMPWLKRAMETKGHALAVALALRFYHGLQREPEVLLLTYAKIMEQCPGCERTIKRGLKALEGAGLITVARPLGSKMQIRFVDPPTKAIGDAARLH